MNLKNPISLSGYIIGTFWFLEFIETFLLWNFFFFFELLSSNHVDDIFTCIPNEKIYYLLHNCRDLYLFVIILDYLPHSALVKI